MRSRINLRRLSGESREAVVVHFSAGGGHPRCGSRRWFATTGRHLAVAGGTSARVPAMGATATPGQLAIPSLARSTGR
nr:hypothetical protein [Deltaproteobacteria bacterium]